MRRVVLIVFSLSLCAFAAEPIKVCVAQPSGPEAKNWKLQSPVAKRLEQDAAAKQLDLTAPLLTSDTEKRAKSEAGEKSCGYVLMTTIESARDQVFGTFNPDPRGKSQGDINRSTNATPTGINVKYKLITTDGKKVAANTVQMSLKENAAAADFEEAGHKLIENLSSQVVTALAPAK